MPAALLAAFLAEFCLRPEEDLALGNACKNCQCVLLCVCGYVCGYYIEVLIELRLQRVLNSISGPAKKV